MATSQRPPLAGSSSVAPPVVASHRPPPADLAGRDAFESRPRYRALLVALREVVSAAGSMKDLLRNARDLLHALLDAERVTLFATDPRNTTLWSLARSSADSPLRVARTHASLLGLAAILRRTITVRNAYDAQELRSLHAEIRHDAARDVGMPSRTRQVLVTPVLGARSVVGVIEFVNSLDGMDFRPDDVQLAEEVARLLGPALEAQLGAVSVRPEGARFGLLVARGLVSDAQVQEAFGRARQGDGDVAALLMSDLRVPREAIGESLADWHHTRFFAWDGRFRMSKALLDRVPASFMRSQVCAPVALLPDGALVVVAENPENLDIVDALRARRIAPRIELAVGLRRDILAYIDASVAAPAPSGVQLHPPLLDARADPTPSARPTASHRPAEPAESDAVKRLVDALDERASNVPDTADPLEEPVAGAQESRTPDLRTAYPLISAVPAWVGSFSR